MAAHVSGVTSAHSVRQSAGNEMSTSGVTPPTSVHAAIWTESARRVIGSSIVV